MSTKMTDNLQNLSLFKSINIRNDLNELVRGQQIDKLAGFLQNGKFSWIAYDAKLRIVSTDTGVEIAYYNFAKHYGAQGCIITCVEEVKYTPKVCLLAVSIEFLNVTGGVGMISIFCVQGSKILGSMDMCERITSCKYLDWETCRRSVLRQYHGVLAIGTEQGKLFLVDLMIPKDTRDIVLSPSYESEIFPLINVLIEEDQMSVTQQHKKIVNSRESGEKLFFAIQLKQVLDNPGSIISILCMPTLFMMAVGLDDGRMILYDLVELQAFHLAYPPGNRAPLTHMSYIEPVDDPRSAVYIWAFHSSKDGAIAVMHSIMFENRVNGYYENFRSCSVRLTMPIFAKDTFPVCCRSVTKSLTQDDDDILTINLLAWTSPNRKRTNVMIFDLNQWYKEEMPSIGDWRNQLKYAVVFEIANISLDVMLDNNSLLPFNSILRPEEHFYPNSLSFDIIVIECDKFTHHRWRGVQNLVLQQFNVIGPQMILEPNFYFNELLQVAISPQFYDASFNIATSIELKREFLLSVALEYNFTSFLKKCAWAWADGSYLGKDGKVGVGLSTLTEWIWNRVLTIKEVCNSLCQPLFDYSEQRIDCGTQKQLSLCCKQLKNLSDLLQAIIKDYRKFIPENIQSQIETQADTVKMASDYQEVLQWLLNVGLLPEGNHEQDREMDTDDDFIIVPYPYRTINSHYISQRSKLNSDDDESKYLFIDAFIENECNSKELFKVWDVSCYPPKSIQYLLRSLLIPDISLENKYVIFVYLFMDITNVLNETSYSSIVRNLIKFPAVFKMHPAMIKRTQAFWNLDNGQLDTAVEELISPLSQYKYLPQWQRELLIGALLKQNANSLALRALRCPGQSLSSEVEVATLLANNLLSTALKVQRASGDRALLEKLFHKILHSENYEQLLDLALSEDEGKVLRDYLQHTDISNCVNLHFVYLLQRSKFIDAAQLMDSFSSGKSNINLEPPKQVLNAYFSTMESTTRRLTSMVYADDQIQVKDSPLPLSVSLIKTRCNATNDIYKKCVESITEATYDSTQDNKQVEMPFIGKPKLGIFEYQNAAVQMEDISYPKEFNEHGKRPIHDNNNGIFKMDDFEGPRMKRRRIDEMISAKKVKSYAEKRISLLTNFRNLKPKLNFTLRTPSTSSRVTPERTPLFTDLLRTPVVEKKTPHKIMPERAATPASILKTRSCRSSISPTHSRYSEFDDNKSVKSITFAAMPDTRDSSLNESFRDESFGGADQLDSSIEQFYSPEKSPRNEATLTNLDGPKPRPSIKSRSTTPKEQSIMNNTEEILMNVDDDDDDEEEIIQSEITAQSTGISENKQDLTQVNVTYSSSGDVTATIQQMDVLKSSDDENDENESESENEVPDKSIYGFVRKSVLSSTYGEVTESSNENSVLEPPIVNDVLESSSSSSNNDDINEVGEDEHFEEEELPEHSDYDDDESEDDEYGEINLDESDSESEDDFDNDNRFSGKHQPPAEDEIIEIPDSDDDEVVIENPKTQVQSALPSFNQIDTQQQQSILFNQPQQQQQESNEPTSTTDDIDDFIEMQTVTEEIVESEKAQTEENMIEILYDIVNVPVDNDEEEQDELNEEIESPQFENISPMKNADEEPKCSQESEKKQEIDQVEESEDVEMVEEEVAEKNLNEAICEQTEVESEKPNVSEMSEECSFVSASGGELNVAVLDADNLDTTTVNDDDKIQLNQDETIKQLTQETENKQPSQDIEAEEIKPSQEFEDKQQYQDIEEKQSSQDVKVEDKQPSQDVEKTNEGVETSVEIMEIQEEESNNALNEAIVNEEDLQVTTTTNEEMQQVTEANDQEMDSNDEKIVETDKEKPQIDPLIEPLAADDQEMPQTTVNDEEISNIEENSVNPLEIAQIESESQTEIESESQTEEVKDDQIQSQSENPLEVAMIEETEFEEPSELDKSNSQIDENDKEIVEIMQNAPKSPESSQNVPVDLSTPKRRSSSRGKTEENILKRAASVPTSGTSSPRSRSSRASSEFRHNPKSLLKERILERIEESPSGVLTRNKSKLLEQQSREGTPTKTPTSRAPSEEIDSVKRITRARSSTGTPNALTPRRTTRASSRESLASSIHMDEKTPEDLTRSESRRGRKKTITTSDDEGDDAKSVRSTRSTSSKKKATSSASKLTPELTSPIDEITESNRRLTRSQLAVLEKSRLLTEKIAAESASSSSAGRLRASKSDLGPVNYDGNDSDNESVKSEKSKTSSRPGRKRKLPKRFGEDDDSVSIKSVSSTKSKSPTKSQKHQLSVIPEEDSGEINESTRKTKSNR